MDKEKLITELREKFLETKRELGFKADFDEFEDIFFIKDYILREKFVSERFSRQMCSRILDMYNSWIGYLNNFLMPNPANLLLMMESRMLDDEDKKKISEIIKKAVALTSTNSLIILTKDKKEEARFIDDSIRCWKDYFKPELIKIMTKINKGWREEK